MHLTVIRSGGFAGVTRSYAVNPADLSPEDAAAIYRLVHQLHSKQRAHQPAPTIAPSTADAFQYDLEIDEAGAVLRFACVELHDPSPALELARTVIAHAAH